jgi:hypothetical protein
MRKNEGTAPKPPESDDHSATPNKQPCQACRESGFPISGNPCPRCGWSSKSIPAPSRLEQLEAIVRELAKADEGSYFCPICGVDLFEESCDVDCLIRRSRELQP